MDSFSTLNMIRKSNASASQDQIVLYPAYSAGTHTVIDGRVVEKKNTAVTSVADRKRDNLRRNLNLMINNERKQYPITVRLGAREWNTTTDHEGYFRVEIAQLEQLAPGWHRVTAQTANALNEGSLLIVSLDNVHGILSDVDDTVRVTEVNSMRRMLANTFLKNPLQRSVVPGIVAFYRDLMSRNAFIDSAPMFYLSAAPRQLHSAIEEFLQHNDFPRGVLLTKRVTGDASGEPLFDQTVYKTQKIENLLTRLPHVRFTLVGDDGESDPEIYADIQKRHPDRVEAIWIRQVNPNRTRARIPGQEVLNTKLGSGY